MPNSPVQVVLNADDFRTVREVPSGGGPGTDFFADQDDAFGRHRTALLEQVEGVRRTLEAQSEGEVGFVKVTLRRSAWAKSHRPFAFVLRPDRTPVVGGADLGQVLIEVTPAALDGVADEIIQAEPETRWKERDGRLRPNPSRRRSETGAIEKIALHTKADKRRFSVTEAMTWLRNGRTGGAYRVELFALPPPRGHWDLLPPAKRRLYQSFAEGLSTFGQDLAMRPLTTRGKARPALAIRLARTELGPTLFSLPSSDGPRSGFLAPLEARRSRHAELLAFLDRHPLVRRIELPSLPVRSNSEARRAERAPQPGVALPPRSPGAVYPRVGVIDGGIGAPLDPWTVGRYGFLSPNDRDPTHGTFIGGLLAGGQAFNDTSVAPEPDGCDLVDVDVYPGDDETKFASYFGAEGVLGFLAEVGNAVRQCRSQHNTRIYNLSINAVQPVNLDRYSEEAQALDEIAEENDAVIVISAGNLDSPNGRPEWAPEPTAALAQLAAARDDGLRVPAESARNVSVGALNAPGPAHAVAQAPAIYSRRGPGLRSGVKPDYSHVGGTGTRRCALETGLFSIGPDGKIYSDCGTSFAAPFVAKTLALLDAKIEGEVSRETLLALAAHSATLPAPLKPKILAGVARQLAGFGCLRTADEILDGDAHQITLVFASRLRINQQLQFAFSWPASLVGAGGRCRGRAKLTLFSTPPLDYRFGAEFVRVNLEAALQQLHPTKNQGKGGWEGRLKPAYLPGVSDSNYEAELIEHGLKWSPVKIYTGEMVRGSGRSSDWRLVVDYLTRAGEVMPEDGVPFTAILTIEDPWREAPIFNDMRQTLRSIGVRTSDIRTAARIVSRV